MEKQVYMVTVTGERTEWRNAQGQLHRLDGPAVEWADGSKAWWQNSRRHRLDGPAREWADGTNEWWQNGVKMTEEEFLAKTQPKELTLDEIAAKFGITVEQLKIKK